MGRQEDEWLSGRIAARGRGRDQSSGGSWGLGAKDPNTLLSFSGCSAYQPVIRRLSPTSSGAALASPSLPGPFTPSHASKPLAFNPLVFNLGSFPATSHRASGVPEVLWHIPGPLWQGHHHPSNALIKRQTLLSCPRTNNTLGGFLWSGGVGGRTGEHTGRVFIQAVT